MMVRQHKPKDRSWNEERLRTQRVPRYTLEKLGFLVNLCDHRRQGSQALGDSLPKHKDLTVSRSFQKSFSSCRLHLVFHPRSLTCRTLTRLTPGQIKVNIQVPPV